ncbi:MAG: hypothetical protein IPJ61_09725 [Tessaracoccus sp.]|uniref:hypothetical protein n=1 Tax=Tessaracoccus sp. TaxID=1971211 RepID=UPI001EB14EA0|nr:hypothetical protein [Tessaracoccus sp.]MBK7821340.1 hypothetical protein [Tessaracoccus sp.]
MSRNIDATKSSVHAPSTRRSPTKGSVSVSGNTTSRPSASVRRTSCSPRVTSVIGTPAGTAQPSVRRGSTPSAVQDPASGAIQAHTVGILTRQRK